MDTSGPRRQSLAALAAVRPDVVPHTPPLAEPAPFP